MSKNINELEKQIYDAYYEMNPMGDARYNLWGDVIKAKKAGIEEMKELLNAVIEGEYDGI